MEEIKKIESYETARDNYKQFGYYANSTRALASDVDGLKVVYRRMLWTAISYPKGKFIKSAVIAGECMKIHPHGEQSGVLYSLVNSKLRLFDKQGNFGSALIPGSAPRYTECRSNKMTEFYLGQDLINYCEMVEGDIGYMEPKYLPTLIPYVLVDGNTSMGIGVASSMPSLDILDLIRYFKNPLIHKDDSDSIIKLDLGLCKVKSSVEDISKSIMSGSVKGFRFSPIVSVENNNSLVISKVPEGMSPNRIHKIFEEGIERDLVDFRDESNSLLRLVYEVHKGDFNQYKNEVEKLSSTVPYDLVFTSENHIKYVGMSEVRDNTLRYLKECSIRKFSKEVDRLNKQLQIAKILQYLKDNNLLKELPSMDKEDLLRSIPFEEVYVTQTLQLPISKLMKGSTEDEIKDLENSINEAKFNLENPEVYLIKLYNDLEEEVKKFYKNNTVYSNSNLSNESVVQSNGEWYYKLSRGKLEVSCISSPGFRKLNRSKVYICKKQGDMEVIEINNPLVMNEVVGVEEFNPENVYILLGVNDREVITFNSEIVPVSRRLAKGEVRVFKKLKDKVYIPCEKGRCRTSWMMASSRITKFRLADSKILENKL